MTVKGYEEPAAQQPITPSYQKILVAVDYLDSTREVFEHALALAKNYHSELMVFHCVQGQMPGMPEFIAYAGMGGYSGLYSQDMIDIEGQLIQEATEELHRWLATFVKRGTEMGINTNSDYVLGEAGQEICALAQRWQADLIVVGRRGRHGLSEFLLGSVSNYVIHHAHCCVLVVQH